MKDSHRIAVLRICGRHAGKGSAYAVGASDRDVAMVYGEACAGLDEQLGAIAAHALPEPEVRTAEASAEYVKKEDQKGRC